MARIPRHNAFVTIIPSGIPQTAAALGTWSGRARNEFDKERKEIEELVKKKIQDVLATGRSKSTKFRRVKPMTRQIRRHRGYRGGVLPFKEGTGEMSQNVRVKVAKPSLAQAEGGRKVLFKVTADVHPKIKQKARAVIRGASIGVTEKMQHFFRKAEVRWIPKKGTILIIPPRDFLRAGVQDAMPELQNRTKEVITRTNRKTVAMMPVIRAAPSGWMIAGLALSATIGVAGSVMGYWRGLAGPLLKMK